MMDGSKISCVGVVGDGCGGGREFIVEGGVLYAYDPTTQERLILLQDIEGARAISKSQCIIQIECTKKIIRFDLSKLAVVE
jgi:hypothetical protein